jgi:thioredoxin-related protein
MRLTMIDVLNKKWLNKLMVASLMLLAGMLYSAQSLQAADVSILSATDLQEVGQLSEQKKLPVMLVFVAEHCPYCVLLEEEFIKPMLISGDYGNRVIIRRLDISNLGNITDFQGNTITADEFANRHGIFVTPTILFLDQNGKELADRMIGINTVEFYGGYLDDAIASSLKLMRNRSGITASLK